MSAPKMRIDYPALDQIAQQFTRQADATRQTLHQLQGRKDILQAGDWVGSGATQFFQEMDQNVLPSLTRLAEAMDKAGHTVHEISRLMELTGEEVARLFAMDGAIASSRIGGVVEAEIASGAEAVLPGAWAGPTGARTPRNVGISPGPGDTEIVSISERDPKTGAWLSYGSFTRPRAADARERKVQALIDKALKDPTPENYQAAIDDAVKLYDVDVSAVRGKPTFEPGLDPRVLGQTDTITQKVIIGESAFKSPGQLASTIRHESFHAENAQDYWHIDDDQSWIMMHVQVYDKQLAYAEHDRLRQSQIDEIARVRSVYYDGLTPSNKEQVDSGIYTIPR